MDRLLRKLLEGLYLPKNEQLDPEKIRGLNTNKVPKLGECIFYLVLSMLASCGKF